MSAAQGPERTDELALVDARVRKLADEKSYLQLIIRLIEQINPLPGIEDMVTRLLCSILETVGGTNIKLYYWIESELHYADFAGERKILTAIDDSLVAESAERREFLGQAKAAADGLIHGNLSPSTWTWAFPLAVGNDLVGVIKVENQHFPIAPLRPYLPIFFRHAALILSNEIRSHTRRLAEAELERYRDHLELLVQERTEELREREATLQHKLEELSHAHEKLKQMGNRLLQAEKLASLGQLAAGVAHEINNPMGFVNSNLGTLKTYTDALLHLLEEYGAADANLPPDLRQRIGATKSEIDLDFLRQDIASLIAESSIGIERVRRIVQDLRSFAHPGESHRQLADLHAGLESTLNVAWNKIKDKAEVIRDYGDLPLVECLPSQINQVILNLLLNAAQAIAERGQITLRTRCHGDWVSIAVSDNGHGIAPEHREKVFDPFFTTRQIGSGPGLGLSTAYGIVTSHGGRIDIDSEPGRGSTFTVWLPVHGGVVAAPEPTAA